MSSCYRYQKAAFYRRSVQVVRILCRLRISERYVGNVATFATSCIPLDIAMSPRMIPVPAKIASLAATPFVLLVKSRAIVVAQLLTAALNKLATSGMTVMDVALAVGFICQIPCRRWTNST